MKADTRLELDPQVTWLLAVRNGMPHLSETLASIEAQTYLHWQVLAWDNGSDDGTVEELRRWIPERLPGKIVDNRPMPLGESRAHLVQEATTELCAWIDADDINIPHRLELQVSFITAHPGVAAVGGQLTTIDAAGQEVASSGRFALADHDIVCDMLDGPGMAQPAVLFRRSAVLAVGNYRNVGPVNVEDYDLWLRLAARYQLANLRERIIKYRVHDGGSTVIAEREGQLQAATMARFAEHAPVLYGCPKRAAKLLSLREHPFALPPLLKIARHLEGRSGVSMLRTLRASKFTNGANTLLAPGDRLTRSALRLFRMRPLASLHAFVGRVKTRRSASCDRREAPPAQPPKPGGRWAS
jgi:hypothetical protein